MSAAHTPGPWIAEGIFGGGVGGTVSTESTPEGELKVITRDIHGRTDDELIANTHLIAAAPYMLAALREISTARPLGKEASELMLRVEFIARSAIARATGA